MPFSREREYVVPSPASPEVAYTEDTQTPVATSCGTAGFMKTGSSPGWARKATERPFGQPAAAAGWPLVNPTASRVAVTRRTTRTAAPRRTAPPAAARRPIRRPKAGGDTLLPWSCRSPIAPLALLHPDTATQRRCESNRRPEGSASSAQMGGAQLPCGGVAATQCACPDQRSGDRV